MPGRTLIESFEAEYRRYKALGEGALTQVTDDELSVAERETDNSIIAIAWHLTGNLISRFSDFRTSDGEKPDRDRESEFDHRQVTRAELMDRWNTGWNALLSALAGLSDTDLSATIAIRRQPLRIDEALLRSLSHTAYHTGQIVYLAKALRGVEWTSLSIPRGMSEAYNRSATREHATDHAAAIQERLRSR
jgi:uncharacterized damage-inducible protein DinB